MITEAMRAAIKKVADLRMLDEREVTFIALAIAPELLAQGMEKAADIALEYHREGGTSSGVMARIRASAAQTRGKGGHRQNQTRELVSIFERQRSGDGILGFERLL